MKATYMIDGKLVTLSDFRSQVQDVTLKEALGDYITAKNAHKAGIKNTTLLSWRNSGRIRARKVKSTWYYSIHDLLELIKTSNIDGLLPPL